MLHHRELVIVIEFTLIQEQSKVICLAQLIVFLYLLRTLGTHLNCITTPLALWLSSVFSANQIICYEILSMWVKLVIALVRGDVRHMKGRDS